MFRIIVSLRAHVNAHSWRFFVFYGVALAFLFTGETVGLFLCSLFYDVGIANMLSAVRSRIRAHAHAPERC